ncbi:MAG TPA: hypothetical protein VEV62_13990 [Parafilimonas sp.]|nr:hypothetical protein [Parafilimonas sp.]
MKLIIYRLLSFLLAPIAVLFSISALLLIGTALSNPAMLFPLFLIICIAIYSFASLHFLIKGIDGSKYLGKSSKDWLKVNAYACIIFILIIISEFIVFIMHPEMLQQIIAQAKQSNSGLNLNEKEFHDFASKILYLLLAYALVLLTHVLMSFQYIRQYSYLFQNKSK